MYWLLRTETCTLLWQKRYLLHLSSQATNSAIIKMKDLRKRDTKRYSSIFSSFLLANKIQVSAYIYQQYQYTQKIKECAKV